MVQKLFMLTVGVSFAIGVVVGYHLKTLRIEYLKRKRNRLVNKLADAQIQLEKLADKFPILHRMAHKNVSPIIIVHGGAWAIPDILVDSSLEGVKMAVKEGHRILLEHGTALDAVETAVCSMEDNPVFDAGTGSVLTEDGEVEMDAIIMDGMTLKSGAVAAVQNIKNPVHLARLVMKETDHMLLVGKGANHFATRCGIPQVELQELVTDSARKEWQDYHMYNRSVQGLFSNGMAHDTVGAVAMDYQGNFACATSTGGITSKMAGRVGDSSIIGCGAYCDNRFGAISCTGHGESIMKVCLAHHITRLIEQGETCHDAVAKGLRYMKKRVNGFGGAVAIDSVEGIGIDFTTKRMTWACIKNNTLTFGVNKD